MLSEIVKRDLLGCIRGLGSGRPLSIVVASNDYAAMLDNWLCHMHALDIRRVLVVAMDDILAVRLSGAPFAVVRAGFNGSETDFWLQRAIIWSFLLEQDIEFIQSDVDAVWLRDPVAEYGDTPFDLAISEGTGHPLDIHAMWRFVLCTGFFWVRPTQAARRLFHMLVTPPEAILRSDDQAVLNRLLAGTGMFWMSNAIASYDMRLHNLPFRCFQQPVPGFCASLGLRLMLLPHHLFPRLPPGAPDAIVRHVLRDGSLENRIEQMRQAGCWRLDAHPGGFALDRP